MNNCETISEKPSNTPESSISTEPTLGARALLRVVRGYQHLRAGHQSPCRFYPSCSQYAVEAITLHGAWRGAGLALRRLSKCRPLGPHGVDLVPSPTERRHP